MDLIVQKYGGTSVGSGERMIHVANIIQSFLSNQRLIVVLSAMSSYTKTLGTTSRLLEACREVLIPHSQRYFDIIDSIQASHLQAIRESVKDEITRNLCEKDVLNECQRLRSFCSVNYYTITSRLLKSLTKFHLDLGILLYLLERNYLHE
jgi:aspartate kinase